MSVYTDKDIIILALWTQKLHKSNICARNHDLWYDRGWFKLDDEKSFRDSDLVAKAQDLVDNGCTACFRQHGMADIPTIVHPEEEQ